MIQVTCLSCGERVQVEDDRAGTMIRCPKCRTAAIVPERPMPPVGKDAPAATPLDEAAAAGDQPRFGPPAERVGGPAPGGVTPPMRLSPASPEAGTSWFYAVAREQYGPVPHATVVALLRAGQIASDALVWREGMTRWTPAGHAPELAAIAATMPAPGGARRGLATASLVIGLGCALIWCLHLLVIWVPLTGVVLGVFGLKSSRRGQAIAGIILGIAWMIVFAVIGIWAIHHVLTDGTTFGFP